MVSACGTPGANAGTIDNDVDLTCDGYQQRQREVSNTHLRIVDSSETTQPSYDHKAPVWIPLSLESLHDAGGTFDHKTKLPHIFDQVLYLQGKGTHLTPHVVESGGPEVSHDPEGKVYHAFAVPSGWSSTFFPC